MEMSVNMNNGMSPIGDESDIEGEASQQGGGDTTGNGLITSKSLSINGFGMISNQGRGSSNNLTTASTKSSFPSLANAVFGLGNP